MSMTDPISDLLTRIRNAQMARKSEVSLGSSRLKQAVVKVLKDEGYVADFRIAALFVEAARRALAPGGTLLVVTKQPSWYLEQLPTEWDSVAREEVKHYHVIEAVRRDGAAEITWGRGDGHRAWEPEDDEEST
jgi:ribosomal protein S8